MEIFVNNLHNYFPTESSGKMNNFIIYEKYNKSKSSYTTPL